jgi:hypothetical protein
VINCAATAMTAQKAGIFPSASSASTRRGHPGAYSEDKVIARANNLLIGRAAYETAVRLYPRDTIQYRNGARIIAGSEPKAS